MSSKKNHQKPADQKHEAEPVDGPIETKAETPADEAPTEPATQPPDASLQDAGEPAAPAEAAADSQDEELEPDAEVVDDVEPFASLEQRDPFTRRLSKAVNGLLTSGNPEAVHALHKVELLLGDLKNALPAAIVAAGGAGIDEDIEFDLQSLHEAL